MTAQLFCDCFCEVSLGTDSFWKLLSFALRWYGGSNVIRPATLTHIEANLYISPDFISDYNSFAPTNVLLLCIVNLAAAKLFSKATTEKGVSLLLGFSDAFSREPLLWVVVSCLHVDLVWTAERGTYCQTKNEEQTTLTIEGYTTPKTCFVRREAFCNREKFRFYRSETVTLLGHYSLH